MDVAKFSNGTPVLLKGNYLGIVLSSYLWTCQDAKEFLYRIIVNSSDAMYRVYNNQVDQTRDYDLFKEDLDTLYWHADQLGVMEIFEREIKLYDPENPKELETSQQ